MNIELDKCDVCDAKTDGGDIGWKWLPSGKCVCPAHADFAKPMGPGHPSYFESSPKVKLENPDGST